MKLLTLVLAAMFATAVAGCHREGPAEKAGRSIDNAAKDVRDAVQGKR